MMVVVAMVVFTLAPAVCSLCFHLYTRYGAKDDFPLDTSVGQHASIIIITDSLSDAEQALRCMQGLQRSVDCRLCQEERGSLKKGNQVEGCHFNQTSAKWRSSSNQMVSGNQNKEVGPGLTSCGLRPMSVNRGFLNSRRWRPKPPWPSMTKYSRNEGRSLNQRI